MRLIFAGTPDFSAPCLQALLDAGHEVVAVYTQPDRPAGRGRKLQASPVKQLAVSREIPVEQPVSLKDQEAQERLANWQADMMIVVAYGLILPQAVLDTPKHGCINVHASLLPRWRGAAPIQRAIQAGDSETGITIMQMDAGLDTGDMLAKTTTPISNTETSGSLHDRLSAMGADLLVSTLTQHPDWSLEVQDDALANYANKLDTTEAVVDWQRPAIEIDQDIRAFNPWPVCRSFLDGKLVKFWVAEVIADQQAATAGSIVATDNDGIHVATGDGTLVLTEIQPAGGKRMPAADFARSRDLIGQAFTGQFTGQPKT